ALTLVAKVPSDDPVSLATANGQHLYEREVRFYDSIAPTVTIRTPVCHHASFDPTTGRFLLLLESLAPAAACDQLDGLAPERAALAVDQLAGLHAPHWGSSDLPATSFLESVADSLRPLYAELIPVLFTGFLDRYGDALSPAARGVVEWLSPNLGAYFQGRETPPTVTHGDYRTDNLLFDGRGGEVPLATVDWQTIGHGPGALDLAYLLTTSLDTETRRAHERELLDRYRSRLGELGVTGYSHDALCGDYAFYAFQGIVMLVCAAVLVERTARGDAMFLTMIERSAAAVDDLGSRRLLAA
ncbi:MAG TPA: phosphotransferase, partial [Acidimicrobiales bacterium]|nr:phosphotransferase [Acidimicrobiales bacterium]